ncbi:MAG: helix-turn-helix domain-containing protein [Woeseiaceae bacterium]|nr:helix-turn-helix domain-containing protein [Woeseiaceae bacterium]
MPAAITQVFVGFSILAAPVLLVAYLFFLRDMDKSPVGRLACVVLLGSMFGLQIYHLLFLLVAVDPFAHRTYMLLLLATPAAFFFFSREVLVAGSTRSPLHVLHLIPIAAGPFLPLAWIPSISFVLGAGYSVWFAMYVFGLRRHVHRYLFELSFFCYFAVLAVTMLVLATSARALGNEVFFISYALFTGASFVLVTAAMIWFPEILADMSDAARLAYTSTTLGNVDVDDRLAALTRAMDDDKLFENVDLSLAMLADAVGLSPHQLSELINTRFGYGFSRYVREHRVAAAQRMLRGEPSASVLSISLATGFRSQSNFYAAFREITGMSPGAWRNQSSSRRRGS